MVNAALPSRLALVVAPVIGLLLAYAVDQLRAAAAPAPGGGAGLVARLRGGPAAAAAHPAADQRPRADPDVHHRRRLDGSTSPPGGVLTPLPLTVDVYPDGQRWQAYALAHRQGEFRIPAGFFLGPGGPDGRGRIGPVPRTFDTLMDQAGRTGLVPIITEGSIEESLADLRYWGVEAVVLADRVHGAKYDVDEEALRRTATALLGAPQRVDDVWIWRIPPTDR